VDSDIPGIKDTTNQPQAPFQGKSGIVGCPGGSLEHWSHSGDQAAQTETYVFISISKYPNKY
jgi:hypothetical protein